MSAAATAAGYLYANGLLRGRQHRDPEDGTMVPAKIEQPCAPKVQEKRVPKIIIKKRKYHNAP